MSTPWPHITVLRDEAVTALAPQSGETMVDCTLGMGGHAEALLHAAPCKVIGIDRDAEALAIAKARLAPFGDRFMPLQGPFGNLANLLDSVGVDGVDGILADLGVSSLQLDTPGRGFSFRFSGPIDMRMDPSTGRSAADVVNQSTEESLTTCIFDYGEERHARRIASAIVQGRPWHDTASLAAAIAAAVPRSPDRGRIHPATRTFQAIRILVNDELGELERLLSSAIDRLKPGGRLAVISFHSLEDRIVKQRLARESGKGVARDPYGRPVTPARLRVLPDLTPPSDDPNPRARSARLRIAVRLP